jgi:hypothetical protein
VFPNKTALIKTKFGKHEVMYNFEMLKHYYEEEVKKRAQTPEEAEKDLNPEPPKRTYSKKNIEIRPDNGPVTRSKSIQLQNTNKWNQNFLRSSGQKFSSQKPNGSSKLPPK